MQVGSTLFSHMPLAAMPFQTHDTVIFQAAEYLDPAQSEKKRVIDASYAAVDARAEKYKNDPAYAYHPHNMNKHSLGQNVDFIIA